MIPSNFADLDPRQGRMMGAPPPPNSSYQVDDGYYHHHYNNNDSQSISESSGILSSVDDEDDDINNMNNSNLTSTISGIGIVDTTTTENNSNLPLVDFDDPRISELPRILLMGPRRGGKTSIQRVIFHKTSPHETLFRLEATQSIERAVVDHTPLCRFTIWDFPGDYYGSSGGDAHVVSLQNSPSSIVEEPSHEQQQYLYSNGDNTTSDAYIYSRATALIFVIDAQDEPYDHVLQNFTETVSRAIRVNPNVTIEVFINKVDGELFLSDEAKYDCRRDIMQQVSDELYDAGLSADKVSISYHLTSIYDHSVFESFSRVVQKLIPQVPTLENLLNVLVSTCSMEKAYLFDVASKLYISTDSSPVDSQSVELCSDMIDVVLDVSGIYGYKNNIDDEEDDMFEHENNINSNENNADVNDSSYDNQSSSVIRLSNGMVRSFYINITKSDSLIYLLITIQVLYLREVDTMLALVCLTRSDNFRKKSLINYNIDCLKKALGQLVVE